MLQVKNTRRDARDVTASHSIDAALLVKDAAIMSRPEIAALMPPLTALVRTMSARIEAFPLSCCEYAAGEVSKLGLGLSYVNGIYTHGKTGYSHAWNISPELGVYVDVTARQFSQELPSILIVPVGSDFAQRHYMRDWHIAW